jgi:hypothetical protein
MPRLEVTLFFMEKYKMMKSLTLALTLLIGTLSFAQATTEAQKGQTQQPSQVAIEEDTILEVDGTETDEPKNPSKN